MSGKVPAVCVHACMRVCVVCVCVCMVCVWCVCMCVCVCVCVVCVMCACVCGVCVCVVCLCVCVCVCVCGVCACRHALNYPISPGKVSHVVGIKGDMCSCPHTLPGFAWWFGIYRHTRALCGVCVYV